MQRRMLAQAFVVAVLSLMAGCSKSSEPEPEVILPPPGAISWPLWGSYDAVRAIAVADDRTVYVGGTFTRMGAMSGGGVPVLAGEGAVSATFPKVDGEVDAVVPDGAGGWYVGGQFQRAGGEPRQNLAHILADGTLDSAWTTAATGTDPYDPNFNGRVSALAFDGAQLYVAGYIDTLGGQPRSGLGAVDAAGQVTSWAPAVAPGSVNALALRSGTVYLGGMFSTVNGEARSNAAAVDAAGTLMPWNPGAVGVTASGWVMALEVDGDTIFLGGWFDQMGGAPRFRLAAVDATTGAAMPWSPAIEGRNWGYAGVQALAVDGGTLYVGGVFDFVDGQARSGLAAFDASGTLTGFAPALDTPDVHAVAATGGVVYASGYFSRVGGEPRSHVAAFDASGALTPWDPDLDEHGFAGALAASGGAVYIGGSFKWIGKATRRAGLAAVDPNGRVTPWNPGVAGPSSTAVPFPPVHALAVAGDTIYIGGDFGAVGGVARRNLAAVNAAGNVTAWAADTSGPVYALAVAGGVLHVGGRFGSVDGQARSNVAAVDAAGVVTGWNPSANALVTSLALDGSTLYVGGYFTAVAGQRRTALAAVGLDGKLLPFNAQVSGASGWASPTDVLPPPSGIWSLAVDGGTVYLAGDFLKLGQADRYQLAAVDAVSGTATDFQLPDFPGTVHALGVLGQRVAAAGTIGHRRIGNRWGSPALALVARDSTASSWTYYATLVNNVDNTSPTPYGETVAVHGGLAYTGGYFWGWPDGGPRRWGLAAADESGYVAPWDPNASP